MNSEVRRRTKIHARIFSEMTAGKSERVLSEAEREELNKKVDLEMSGGTEAGKTASKTDDIKNQPTVLNRYQDSFYEAKTLLANIKSAADKVGIQHFDKNFTLDMAAFSRRLNADKTDNDIMQLSYDIYESVKSANGYPEIVASLKMASSIVGSMVDNRIDDAADEKKLHPVGKIKNAASDVPPGAKPGQVTEV